MPNLHKLFLIVFASLSMLCLNATAQQVYESTDAQGNVTFSDEPSPGSKEVTIEAPNLSDAVKVPPPSPDTETEQAPQPQPAVTSEQPQQQPEGNNDSDDGGDWLYPDRRYDRQRYIDERRNRTWFPHPEPRGGR
jgi:hypothetical protein